MEKKYVYYHNGIKVDVVEARSDSLMDVQLAVLGDKYSSEADQLPSYFKDVELEADGWIQICFFNGSLFFTIDGVTYAHGIEKSRGIVHENDDAKLDNVMGLYHGHGVPFIVPQSKIKEIIDQVSVVGALTAAFGLVNNGLRDIRGGDVGQPNRLIFTQKSGRTIVGKRNDGTIVMATFDGVTGTSGLTGEQTVTLAKDVLKLTNAVCMDGGGSTYGEYKQVPFNGTTRRLKNGLAMYIRYKVGATKTRTLTVGDSKDGKVFLKEIDSWVDAFLF